MIRFNQDGNEAAAKAPNTSSKAETVSSDWDVESHENYKLINNVRHCGKASIDRIIGGEKAAVNQFPFLVLLEYQTTGTEKVKSFKCGGSLISERYVLTGTVLGFFQNYK